MENYIMYSGGASGADSQWELIGCEYGLKRVFHYYAQGEKTPRGNFSLPKQDLLEADKLLKIVNEKYLKRSYFPYSNNYVNNLLRRNYYQIQSPTEAVYAIATIDKKTNLVNGGTGWATTMAIYNNIPTYVFDQDTNKWYKHYLENELPKIQEIETPTLTKHFTAIGTRDITDQGIKAIRDVYTKTIECIQLKPCKFDHNGDCLICDCWISDCGYQRYLNEDYRWESKKELEQMFKDFTKTTTNGNN
jgi:hypothetical protein